MQAPARESSSFSVAVPRQVSTELSRDEHRFIGFLSSSRGFSAQILELLARWLLQNNESDCRRHSRQRAQDRTVAGTSHMPIYPGAIPGTYKFERGPYGREKSGKG